MCSIPLIKSWNLRKRKIQIAHNRMPNIIYMCILSHICWKSPEWPWSVDQKALKISYEIVHIMVQHKCNSQHFLRNTSPYSQK